MRKRLLIFTVLLSLALQTLLPEIDALAQTRRPRPRRRAPVVKPKPKTTTPTTKETTTPAEAPKPTPPKEEPKPAPPKEEVPPPPKPGPTIWRNPGKVERLDFNFGPGGVENAPKPPFTFIEEDKGGSNPKIKITDATGREWGVKWGSEVNAEVFATRLVWAAGYYVEAAYFVPAGKILGAKKLSRAKKYIDADGDFKDARFELKEKGIKKFNQEEGWRWDNNPFMGTKELNGLKILMMLTSNWDSKDQRDTSRGSNTAIFKVSATGEERFVVTDWGGSMGKWGGVFSREKWDCEGFAKQNREFITSARNGYVEFGYKGQRTADITSNIRTGDVKWLVQYLGRISDDQLRAGLIASGADAKEVGCFTSAIRERLDQLKRISEFRN
jgi:hypothetical protein